MKKCVYFIISVLVSASVYAGAPQTPSSSTVCNATGKKVNSAIDHPSSYYALRSRNMQNADSKTSSKQLAKEEKDKMSLWDLFFKMLKK